VNRRERRLAVLAERALQRHVPAAVLSRVSAYDWLGSVALVPLGFALAGPLADALGVTAVLWLAAGWNVLGSAVVLAVPSVRRLPGASRPTRVLARADGGEHHQQEGGQRPHAVRDGDERGQVPLGPAPVLAADVGAGPGEDVVGQPGGQRLVGERPG
jgi:hypothetical protein